MGVREYARYRSARAAAGDAGFDPCTHAAVAKAIRSGRLKGAVTGTGRATVIDVAQADARWSANTDPAFQRPRAPAPALPVSPPQARTGKLNAPGESVVAAALPPSTDPSHGSARRPPPTDMNGWRLEQIKWETRRERLLYLRERGELVPLEAVRLAVARFARDLQGAGLELPGRVCDELAAEKNPARVRMILERELREVFEQSADAALALTIAEPQEAEADAETDEEAEAPAGPAAVTRAPSPAATAPAARGRAPRKPRARRGAPRPPTEPAP